MDCLFCKIAAGEIPSQKVFEDDQILIFRDIDPQAPIHLLAIPKAHIPSAAAITAENSAVVAHIYTVIAKLSEELGMTNGYRVVTNVGEDGGQTVNHLHFHIMAGRPMAWPAG